LRTVVAAVCCAGALAQAPASASSDQAWSAFRADVATKCTAAAKKIYANPIVVVDPNGSESYGIALVYARPPAPKGSPPAAGLATVVCIYNKRTKAAELSGALTSNFE
jgi:hypothetical protein